MNLETSVNAELWAAISSNYQSGHYKNAILDAMHYLSDVLRSKSGAQGDGVKLVGEALGGNPPILRVNKLQTQTEKDIQNGLEQLLRGMYMAIRNPRSHEQMEDTQQDADAIIYFVNYLADILGQSEESFTIEGFLNSVFDPDFVESPRYTELLVAKVPKNKLLDALIECYRSKWRSKGNELRLITQEILKLLPKDQISQFLNVVSDTFRTTQDEADIRNTLKILPPELWQELQEDARLRIENRLLRSIKDGKKYSEKQLEGALGTWARRFLPYFQLKDEAKSIFNHKIYGDDDYEFLYLIEYHANILPVVLGEMDWKVAVNYICNAIRRGNRSYHQTIVDNIWNFDIDMQKAFAQNLKDITNEEQPALYLRDGSAFLMSDYAPPYPSYNTSVSNVDDIPF